MSTSMSRYISYEKEKCLVVFLWSHDHVFKVHVDQLQVIFKGTQESGFEVQTKCKCVQKKCLWRSELWSSSGLLWWSHHVIWCDKEFFNYVTNTKTIKMSYFIFPKKQFSAITFDWSVLRRKIQRRWATFWMLFSLQKL